MSLRSLLMPMVSARLLSLDRQEALRRKAEARRAASGRPHEVHAFLQVDDPYSALLAGQLSALSSRYRVSLRLHLCPQPIDRVAPERARLAAYGRLDAQRLAQHLGLDWRDPGQAPAPEATAALQLACWRAIEAGRGLAELSRLLAQAWRPGGASPDPLHPPPAAAELEGLRVHLGKSEAQRARWGHYLGATLYYEGEWYWGLDRLHHLEHRLRALGLDQTPGVPGLVPPIVDAQPDAQAASAALAARGDGLAIEFFFSLRSPYSAIAAPRVFALGRRLGVPLRLRYLLPMVMRGLPVPAEKRRYISLDAAREARLHGVPFGRVNDPVGRPTERGLALMPLAQAQGDAQAYVCSFMQGVWAEGIDAGSDRGLRRIAERAGLAWADCERALADESWRAVAETHRASLFAHGLWGVPSFALTREGQPVPSAWLPAWGQDRIWCLERALVEAGG